MISRCFLIINGFVSHDSVPTLTQKYCFHFSTWNETKACTKAFFQRAYLKTQLLSQKIYLSLKDNKAWKCLTGRSRILLLSEQEQIMIKERNKRSYWFFIFRKKIKKHRLTFTHNILRKTKCLKASFSMFNALLTTTLNKCFNKCYFF